MATNKFSLADHLLTITVPKGVFGEEQSFTIGGPGNHGEGSFVGSIKISRETDLWKTEGDATGSWVHNKNLDRTGKCEVDIRQVSDMVVKLSTICNIYEKVQDRTQGLTISVSSISGEPNGKIAICEDCYITKIPEQKFDNEADNQTWTFTCGRVTMYPFNY